MYARVTTIQIQDGKFEEAIGIAKDSIAPLAKEQPGFKNLLALTNPEDEEVLLISLWETEEALHAGEDSGYYEDQIGKLSTVLDGRALRENYTVDNLA
ncbi:MAG: antibiotic biosynthesis monooxygenase [Rubrobacter sp.]|nr:antibiotic biosynthesis monooxygenase [Rubrobacter sp.]